MPRLSVLLCAIVTATGCATDHEGYLLRIGTGQRSPLVFHDKPNGKHGSVEAALADGERCQGQFNTIPDQVTRNPDYYDEIESEDTQVGVAILKCADDHVVKCDFSRAYAGSGSGQCFDNQGQMYSLNF